MSTAPLKSRLPSVTTLNQRLAARFHQRQAAVVRKSARVANRIGPRYRRMAHELAQVAAKRGLAGIGDIHKALDAALDDARQAMGDDLAQAGLDGHDSAAEAVLRALPREWLPILTGLAAARIPEATAPELEPDPWDVTYQWEPIAGRAVSKDEAMQLIRGLLLPAPTEEQARAWLTDSPPGGLSWEDRLRRWEKPARAAMLSELSIGLAAEENVDKLRARLTPFADGLAWKAQRIARTEGNRVAERASRACFDGMGELVDGLQIVAVMDEWTQPEHAARNGRIYRRGEDGVYRDDAGDPLPDLPDRANCRCMTIPVMSMPDEFKKDPALRATFETATKRLIPDPASYADWWERAGERERMTAVGVKRYQAVRDRLGRKPEWTDFVDVDGTLLATDALKREPPAAQQERRIEVQSVLDARKRMFQSVASRGYSLGTRAARPQAIASIPMLSGGVPHQEILDALEMGDPRRVVILEHNRPLVDDRVRELFDQPLSDVQLARLAGALDDADLDLSLESGGLKLEMHRGGVRALSWAGRDDAGVLKLELIRMDVPTPQQRQGLATRSVARSIQQASSLGVQYADVTGVRSGTENGYYTFPVLGFDAEFPKGWLAAHRGVLAGLATKRPKLSDVMRSEAGQAYWLEHGTDIHATMDLRPGSEEMYQLGQYVNRRKKEKRPMAESKKFPTPKYPIYGHGIEITEEDEAIMRSVREDHPLSEEYRRSREEFDRRIRPGTRQKRPDGKD